MCPGVGGDAVPGDEFGLFAPFTDDWHLLRSLCRNLHVLPLILVAIGTLVACVGRPDVRPTCGCLAPRASHPRASRLFHIPGKEGVATQLLGT